jgi:hypothetical protein
MMHGHCSNICMSQVQQVWSGVQSGHCSNICMSQVVEWCAEWTLFKYLHVSGPTNVEWCAEWTETGLTSTSSNQKNRNKSLAKSPKQNLHDCSTQLPTSVNKSRRGGFHYSTGFDMLCRVRVETQIIQLWTVFLFFLLLPWFEWLLLLT